LLKWCRVRSIYNRYKSRTSGIKKNKIRTITVFLSNIWYPEYQTDWLYNTFGIRVENFNSSEFYMGDCWNGRLEDANLLISDEEEPVGIAEPFWNRNLRHR
jgi:hypothetical protein